MQPPRRYKDMTEAERLAAYNRVGMAQLTIEGCRAPSPYAVAKCIREAEFIRRIAKSCGDAWAA